MTVPTMPLRDFSMTASVRRQSSAAELWRSFPEPATGTLRCGFDDAVARLLGNGDGVAKLFEVVYQTSVTYLSFISSFFLF